MDLVKFWARFFLNKIYHWKGTIAVKSKDPKKTHIKNNAETNLVNLGLDDEEEIILVNDDEGQNKENCFTMADDTNDEDDDLKMIEALDNHQSISHANSDQMSTTSKPKMSYSNLTKFVDEEENCTEALTLGLNEEQILSTQYYDTFGYDKMAGSVWIYPDNMPTRSYQYSIVEQCLHKNTMVVLPTGMGKTFIAVSSDFSQK